jgi:NAD(P)-dependent dehydrogenase (short-subunit alcohol dehydrogenase family)
MYDDLKGKVAIVTGAGRPNGLGHGMSMRLAKEGCNVVITEVARPHEDPEYGRGSWEDTLDRKKEIESLGVKCLPVKCDVLVEEEVQDMVNAVVKEFGEINVLVNNVGGGPPSSTGPLIDIDANGWDEGIAVNVKGTHLCSRAVAKQMIQQGKGGKIVNIASQAAKRPFPGLGVYGAGKASVCHYSKTLAVELAPHHINVNAVLPGTIETDMLKEGVGKLAEEMGVTYDVYMEQTLSTIPVGRFQTREDVAASVVWLASAESDYITGETILTTGGQTIY